MSVQSQSNNVNEPFLRGGEAYIRDGQVIAQDGARSTDLLSYTVMYKDPATGKWSPYVAANNVPKGIYNGPDIPFADIVAGDVEAVNIYTGGSAKFDVEKIVFDNGTDTLDTVVTAIPTSDTRDVLATYGLFFDDTLEINETY